MIVLKGKLSQSSMKCRLVSGQWILRTFPDVFRKVPSPRKRKLTSKSVPGLQKVVGFRSRERLGQLTLLDGDYGGNWGSGPFNGNFRGKIIGITWYKPQTIQGIQWLVNFKGYSSYWWLHPSWMVPSIIRISPIDGVGSDGFMRLGKAELAENWKWHL